MGKNGNESRLIKVKKSALVFAINMNQYIFFEICRNCQASKMDE